MKIFIGWFGEKKTVVNLWFTLDSNTYNRFYDAIVLSSNRTTQISDLINYKIKSEVIFKSVILIMLNDRNL
jgi:hypothetical protein